MLPTRTAMKMGDSAFQPFHNSKYVRQGSEYRVLVDSSSYPDLRLGKLYKQIRRAVQMNLCAGHCSFW